MAILAAGRSDVVLRYAGREVTVSKTDITIRGGETKTDAQTRLAITIRGTDRECEVDLGPPVVLWQGPKGATRVIFKA